MLLPTTKTWAETRSNEKYVRSCLQCCIVVKHWMVWTNTLFIWQYYLLWEFYFVEYFEVFQTEIKVSIFKYLHLNYLLNIWEFQNIKLCSLGLFSPVHCLQWIDSCKKKVSKNILHKFDEKFSVQWLLLIPQNHSSTLWFFYLQSYAVSTTMSFMHL